MLSAPTPQAVYERVQTLVDAAGAAGVQVRSRRPIQG